MAEQFDVMQKQEASAFWKAYFRKFKRRIGDQENSATRPLNLGEPEPVVLPFPDRRRARLQRHKYLR